MGLKGTISGGPTWPRSAWPTDTRHCATSSASSSMPSSLKLWMNKTDLRLDTILSMLYSYHCLPLVPRKLYWFVHIQNRLSSLFQVATSQEQKASGEVRALLWGDWWHFGTWRFKANLWRAVFEVDIHIQTSKLCINCCITPCSLVSAINTILFPPFTACLRHKDTCWCWENFTVLKVKMAQTVWKVLEMPKCKSTSS